MAMLTALCVVGLASVACAPAPNRDLEVEAGRSRTPVAPGEVNRSAGCAGSTAAPAGEDTIAFGWDGRHRESLLLVPDLPAGSAAPLLVSLHPFTLGPRVWEQYSGLGAAAVDRGYVVLLPLGSEPGPRWSVPGGWGAPIGTDDLGFVDELVDRVTDRLCIDQNRVFAAGFSAGAAMSVALGCAAPDRFAAVAASGGSNLTSLCPDSPPVDSMILHGSADPIAPLSGSYVVFAPPLGLPVDDVVRTTADRAGCDPTPAATTIDPTLTVDRYEGCGGHRVEYWRMTGAGHTWAGSLPLLEPIVGPTNTAFSATEAVLDFFDATPPLSAAG